MASAIACTAIPPSRVGTAEIVGEVVVGGGLGVGGEDGCGDGGDVGCGVG